MEEMDRKTFLKMATLGAGVVYVSGLTAFSRPGFAQGLFESPRAAESDFYFVQLSDTHWGFEGAKVNPEAKVTLKKAIQTVNSLKFKPDFIVFTGDLTHTTDDPQIRRARMTEFKEIVRDLDVQNIRFLPGEHDASLDEGKAYKEFFGETFYSFDHKGVRFISLDNVSDATGAVGTQQMAWLKGELRKIGKKDPTIILTHRPLFDLMPSWDWATKDGKEVIDALLTHDNVTVFYGHIHQEHHHMTEHIAHHSAKSLIFPLPAPGSVPKKAPIPWDAQHPFRGLGFRSVEEEDKMIGEIEEWPVVKGAQS